MTWLDWEHADVELARFTRRLLSIRGEHAAFRRQRFFSGLAGNGSDTADLAWFSPSGSLMVPADWASSWVKSLAMYLNGDNIPSLSRRGYAKRSDTFLLCLNAADNGVVFTLPPEHYGGPWTPLIDTALASGEPEPASLAPGGTVLVQPFAMVVLSRPRHNGNGAEDGLADRPTSIFDAQS